MEYRDEHDKPIVFRQLQNVFGQFPFLASSVFNFYVSKFELFGGRGWCDVGECHPNTGMRMWPALLMHKCLIPSFAQVKHPGGPRWWADYTLEAFVRYFTLGDL